MNLSIFKKGFSVIEIVVGASIILILTFAFSESWRTYLIVSRVVSEKTQAALILEETSEIIQFLRDKSWATNISGLALNTPYYIWWDGTNYTLTASSTIVQNSFIRTATFSSVTRNGQDDIASSGVVDTKTKKVTISVATNVTIPVVLVQTEMLIHDVHKN